MNETGTRSHLYNSTGFFFLIWAAHYAPFYIMGRQLFLHHYLPAHLASALVAGALVEFVFNIDPAGIEETISAANRAPVAYAKVSSSAINRIPMISKSRSGANKSLLATWAATGAIMSVILWSFFYFAPLTYGNPGLSVDQVVARKWLNYDLHFAK